MHPLLAGPERAPLLRFRGVRSLNEFLEICKFELSRADRSAAIMQLLEEPAVCSARSRPCHTTSLEPRDLGGCLSSSRLTHWSVQLSGFVLGRPMGDTRPETDEIRKV